MLYMHGGIFTLFFPKPYICIYQLNMYYITMLFMAKADDFEIHIPCITVLFKGSCSEFPLDGRFPLWAFVSQYLGDKQDFDVSSEDPSSGISNSSVFQLHVFHTHVNTRMKRLTK